jgi:hypothetical protein
MASGDWAEKGLLWNDGVESCEDEAVCSWEKMNQFISKGQAEFA